MQHVWQSEHWLMHPGSPFRVNTLPHRITLHFMLQLLGLNWRKKNSISYTWCMWTSGKDCPTFFSLALCSSGSIALFLRSVPFICHYLFIQVCNGSPFLSSCSIVHQHLLVAHPAPTAHPFPQLTLTEVSMRLGGWRS